MFNRSPLALALAAILAIPAGVAHAQSTQGTQATSDAETQSEQDKQDKAAQEDQSPQSQTGQSGQQRSTPATTLDTMVVTGSRIEKDVFNSVSPIQVITREESTMAGFSSTSGVLQDNSVTGGTEQINNAFGGYVVDGGPGVNTLSLRGLGPTRTLVLLNGRRVSPAGSRGSVGSADLNVLPSAMIDHIEILKDGASSIYGSDAVAGVVNIITRPKVDGITFEVQQNGPQHSGGSETRFSVIAGTTGDRWRVAGSFEYYSRERLTIGQRGWASECPLPLVGLDPATGRYGKDDYIDPATGKPKCWTLDAGGVTINTLGTPWMIGQAGLGSLGYYGTYYPGSNPFPPGIDYFNRWRPNSSITSGLPGFEGVDYFGRDSYDPRMLQDDLISPAKTYTGFFQGGYDLHALGDAELYFEALLNRRTSNQSSFRQITLDYPVGSPLIPPGLAAALAPWGRFLGPQQTTKGKNVAARAFVGWGPYASSQTVDFYRFTAGLRGNLGSSWKYDFMVSSARSSADYMIESFLTDRMAESMDVIQTSPGVFVCANPAARAAGCIPTPMLNADTLAGNLPQDWRNYIMVQTWGSTVYTEQTLNVNVNGPLFDLPYGTVYGAFGVEYRKSKIDDKPDPNSSAGNLFGLTSALPTYGTDAVREVYAELEFPLLSGVRGAEELTINVSGRYTDYDSYGDNTTYKAGLLWTPISAISLRASYGTSYRAPALFEQFVGATTGFGNQSLDPCNDYGSKNPTSPVYQNCASLGLPVNFNQTSSVEIATVGGAALGLAAETSKALTAGIVLQPEFPAWFGNLSFAADYFDIQVDNGVQNLSAGSILNLCYNSLPSDFNAGSGWCNQVTRNPIDNSLDVTSGYVNISTNKVRGWDFTARYDRDIGPGSFRATVQVTNFLEQSGRTFPTDPLVNWNGTLNSPKYTGSIDLAYSLDSWHFRYGLTWVDNTESYTYYADGDQALYDTYVNTYDLSAPNYILHNISAQYRGDNWSVTAGVRNLSDKKPPRISNGIISTIGNSPLYSGYDYLGRTFFLNISKTF